MQLDPSVVDRPKTLSIGQYGMLRGLPRVLDALDYHRLHASFMVPGRNAIAYAPALREIAERGHEIGNHGLTYENFAELDSTQQRDAMLRANEAIERVIGRKPVGFRTPRGDMTAETLSVAVELGFEWTSMTRGDDRPFFVEVDGKPTKTVEIPVHWELEDFSYFMFNYGPPYPSGQGRIARYSHVLETWKAEFDAYYELGLCYVTMFDPQAIGTPGRIAMLEELLAYVRSHPGVWFATGREVAEHWRRSARANDSGNPLAVFAQPPNRPTQVAV